MWSLINASILPLNLNVTLVNSYDTIGGAAEPTDLSS